MVLRPFLPLRGFSSLAFIEKTRGSNPRVFYNGCFSDLEERPIVIECSFALCDLYRAFHGRAHLVSRRVPEFHNHFVVSGPQKQPRELQIGR